MQRRFTQLKDERGNMQNSVDGMNEVVKREFEKIYRSANTVIYRDMPDGRDFDGFMESEVRMAIDQMKVGKSPGPDKIVPEMLKGAREKISSVLVSFFNECVRTQEIPETFPDALTVLLFKKGDASVITNYRPISLLNIIYKLFTKVVHNRMERVLEEGQTREQAGFRRAFGTVEHIFTVQQVIERYREYEELLAGRREYLYLVFVDFAKAFDSVEYNAVWKSLQEMGVSSHLIGILRKMYEVGKSKVKVNDSEVPIVIERGVRQGDTISPVLFTACLRSVFRTLEWDEKGVRMNGEYLSHLDFADDIVLFARSRKQAEEMVRELEDAAEKVGLRVNASKTVFMTMCVSRQARSPLKMRSGEIECVESVVYLGRELNMESDCTNEIKRRIKAGWGAFANFRSFLTSRSVQMKSKRKIMNSCILPAMTYGAETWALRKSHRQMLIVAQRKMERAMVGVSLLDRRTNEWLRGVTKVADVRFVAGKMKAKWTMKVVRMTDRWAGTALEWSPNPMQRARTGKRWTDEFKEMFGSVREALDLAKRDRMEFMRRVLEHLDRLK